MAKRNVPEVIIILAFLAQYIHEISGDYPIPGILNSRPNASTVVSEKYCVMFYPEITTVAQDDKSAVYLPVADALEWNVCNEEEPPPATLDIENRFIFVSSGNSCTPLERARRIQMLGGAGTLIVQTKLRISEQNNTGDNLTLAFIGNSSYSGIIEGGENVTVGLYSPPEDTFLPLSFLVIWVLAVFSVAVGAFWSGKLRHKLYLSEQVKEGEGEENRETGSHEPDNRMPKEETSMNLSAKSILGFVVLMCLMLLSLYFLFDYLVYVIIAMFCIASGVAMFCCLHPLVMRIPCGACRTPYFNIYLVRGVLEVRQILLLIFSFSLVGVWVTFRKESWAWILQDILGIAFCINVLRLIRLPNLKICTILLTGLILYDIFFVFITPFITSDGKSIMVEVAKGGSGQEQLPMVLKVPNEANLEITRVCYQGGQNYNLLGFGDVLIPGLLISYVHSFDLQVSTPCHLYYLINVLGYGIGLVVTFVALWLMNFAQPALLYLVPFTLIPTYITAAIRGEVKAMWRGDADKFESEGYTGPEDCSEGEEEEGEEEEDDDNIPTITPPEAA
ncbi:hypothetical protein Pcinc_029786 [Petrolisthes cinctipes]|uniref:Signal peptide peptidase-like 2B n=1 Tax=Petrolisthes cinctipes TaxID=88211 RepID=A0AAE1K574_PETCI|nr:hypothetical protein Pcinc_029786 [Petrolisthes cinctipes]